MTNQMPCTSHDKPATSKQSLREWKAEGSLILQFTKDNSDNAVICKMAEPYPADGMMGFEPLSIGSKNWKQQATNARLIAAAPEMYEVLKSVLPWAKDWIKYLRLGIGKGQGAGADDVFSKAEAALAKAEGKA